MTTAAKHIPKVACAIIIVSTPRPDGQPKLASIAMNNNNIDKPVTASGITKGALATRLKNNLPLKFAKRTKAIAINNPNIVEIVAELNPISNDLYKAVSKTSSYHNSLYHLVEKPAQTETSLPRLKL